MGENNINRRGTHRLGAIGLILAVALTYIIPAGIMPEKVYADPPNYVRDTPILVVTGEDLVGSDYANVEREKSYSRPEAEYIPNNKSCADKISLTGMGTNPTLCVLY